MEWIKHVVYWKIRLYDDLQEWKMKLWHQINWKKAYAQLKELQSAAITEHRNGNRKGRLKLQNQIVNSFAARALAVRKVTSNQGAKTPGLDGKQWNTPNKRLEAIEELKWYIENPNQYKATPVKRIYIPKASGTEMRPLGIPTMVDRAMQALYTGTFAIDTIVEETSDPRSYGFRKYKSCQDAITEMRPEGPQWTNQIPRSFSPPSFFPSFLPSF